MLITNVSQLGVIRNLISPTGGALTTSQKPDWAKFKGVAEVTSVSVKEVTSKKDGKIYNILEGASKLGVIQLDLDTATSILEGVKSISVRYKASQPQTKDGVEIQYLNLVPDTTTATATATPTATPEKEVAQDSKGGK